LDPLHVKQQLIKSVADNLPVKFPFLAIQKRSVAADAAETA
jgi:hypothetical protein